MSYSYVITLTSDESNAKDIAHSLVEKKLAACVNINKNITSVYEWEGSIQEDSEFMLFIKTKTELFDDVKAEILNKHSYELPAIVSIPFDNISKDFAGWIDNNTRK